MPREVSWWRGLLELLPGVRPPVPGTAVHVEGSLCFCEGGNILDIHDGRIVRNSEAEVEEKQDEENQDPSYNLYLGRPMRLDGGDVLSRGSGSEQGFHLFRIAPNRERRWHFDLDRERHFVLGNYYSFRYRDEYVYMVVSDQHRELTLDPTEPHGGRYFLWVLEVRTGNVCQKVPIPDGAGLCRIEDVGERHLLISTANKTLFCYGRQE